MNSQVQLLTKRLFFTINLNIHLLDKLSLPRKQVVTIINMYTMYCLEQVILNLRICVIFSYGSYVKRSRNLLLPRIQLHLKRIDKEQSSFCYPENEGGLFRFSSYQLVWRRRCLYRIMEETMLVINFYLNWWLLK